MKTINELIQLTKCAFTTRIRLEGRMLFPKRLGPMAVTWELVGDRIEIKAVPDPAGRLVYFLFAKDYWLRLIRYKRGHGSVQVKFDKVGQKYIGIIPLKKGWKDYARILENRA
jgi:hypothetical protein